jgi:YgiT-type zinc finger domain-containing protein
MTIKTCPTCDYQPIERQRTTVTVEVRGQHFQVPDLELEVCPACGEQLFDLEASRRVQAVVYGKQRSGKSRAA